MKSAFSLRPLVGESLSLVLRGTNVKGVIDIPETLAVIEADEGQISQACNNIIINAVHAMPGGGSLTIAGADLTLEPDNPLGLAPGPYVRLSFRDEGCGICEGDLKRIFDPYFTTKTSGTGLGLASTHSIVNKHGGMILVDSEPGQGTTFTIYLPSTGRPPQPGQENAEIRRTDRGGGRVLVMDDEEMIRELTCEMLGELGYHVLTCSDGAQAVELYRTADREGAPVAAVIMDLTIPGGMGGKEAAGQILEIDPEACLIVSSGYSNDPVMSEHARYGFRATLVKPYSAREIAQVLSRVLSSPP